MEIEKTDLRKIIDPKIPLFFLILKDKNKPIFIRRVLSQSLLVDLHPEMLETRKINGFVVTESGHGILEFEATLQESVMDKEHLDFVEISINPESIKTVNRRQSYRLSLPSPLSAKLIDQDHHETSAKVLNVSAEGILFVDEGFLQKDEIYQLHFKLEDQIILDFPVLMLAKREIFPEIAELKATSTKIHPAVFLEKQGTWNKKTIGEKEKSLIVRYINQKLQAQRILDKENESKK